MLQILQNYAVYANKLVLFLKCKNIKMTLENITLSFLAYAAWFSCIYSIISFLNRVSIFLVLSVYMSNFHTESQLQKWKKIAIWQSR